MLWILRFKGPRMYEAVQLETETDSREDARELADWYIDSLSNPGCRFMTLEPAVVATTAEMKKAKEALAKVAIARAKEVLERKGQPAPVTDPTDTSQIRTPRASSTRGRVGA